MQKALFLSLDSTSDSPPETFQIVIETLIYKKKNILQHKLHLRILPFNSLDCICDLKGKSTCAYFDLCLLTKLKV